MRYLWLIFRSCVRIALWLLAGAGVYFLMFGEPDLTKVGAWSVIVFWPLVLLWYLFWWTLLIGGGVFALVIGWFWLTEKLQRRRFRRRVAADGARAGA